MATRKSAFEEAKDRLRSQARELAEQAYVLQAWTDGQAVTRDQVDQAMADWQPPPEAQVEQRAAQEIVAALDHAKHLQDLAVLAARDLQRGVDRATENLARVREALAEQEAEVSRLGDEQGRWQAEVDALPPHLQGVRPSGLRADAYAQAAEAVGSAGGGQGGVG